MTAPRPDVVAVVCADLRSKSRQVEDGYGWLFASGYEPRRSGGAGGARTSAGGPADRGNAAVRNNLDRTAKKVTAAKLLVAGAGDILGETADLIDQGELEHPKLPDLAVLRGLGSWSENHGAGSEAAERRAQRGATRPGSDYGLKSRVELDEITEAHAALDAMGVRPGLLASRVLALVARRAG